MGQSIQEWTWSNFFKGCLPQILLGPFLNTLNHIISDMMENFCEGQLQCVQGYGKCASSAL